MTHLAWLLIVWGVLTAVLIVLLIYKSTLSMREDDQLFLDESESHMAQEQVEVLRRMNQINPLVRLFGAASGVLILVIAGIWIYQGFTQVQ
jgi:Tfp pilus assembly protein PilN